MVVGLLRPLADAAAQDGVAGVAAEGGTGRGVSGSHQLGKRPGQSVQSAAQDRDVVRIAQVGGQRDLCRLVLQVAPQMCAAQPAPQVALGLGEEVLGRVVRALHDRHDAALPVPRHGMPEEVVPVAVEAVERDRFRTVPAGGALLTMGPDSPAQLAAVRLDLRGDRLQQGGGGCGGQGLLRWPPAQLVVA